MDIPVELSRIIINESSEQQLIVLKECDGERQVPIVIGIVEIFAIDRRLKGIRAPRPMTHDLVRDLLMVLGVTLEKIVVTDLRDKTFFAEMHLNGPNGEQIVSCRPSDALAIAARTDALVYAEPHVLEAAGFQPEPDDVDDDDEDDGERAEEVLDEFREFIDNVNPEDFGG